MKNRNVFAVALLPLVTLGIYSIYWSVSTKTEMNAKGEKIPTAWLLIVPFANIWWLWKHSEGAEHVTGGQMNGILAFILQWFLGSIGQAIIQDSFNKLGEAATAGAAPVAAATDMTAVPPVPPAEPAPTPPTDQVPPATPAA